MYFLYLNLLVSFVIAAGARDRSLRVIGGRDVRPDEFPYVVRLELKDATTGTSHVCTASVLTPTASLTAAHCCVSIANQTLVIRYGTASGRPTEDDRFSDVLSCSKHPAASYSDLMKFESLRDVDIAVLATQPIHVSGYARLSAIDYRVLYGQRVQVLGYGFTEHNGEFDDTLSLKLPLQVMDAMWSRCDEYLIYPMVCVVKACGFRGAICQGDSGGPVVHASGVVGLVTSGTEYCPRRADHSFSVEFIEPISTDVDWITDKLADTTIY